MPYVDSDGWDIWYDVQGSGPPLVLSGGTIMMHNQFDQVTADLARDFTVINWNWRGAGQSERTWIRGITFDHWVDDLTRVLDHLGVDKADFWGGSTGSLFAIRFASRYPERVGRMILYPAMQGGIGGSKIAAMYRDIVQNLGVERQIWAAYWVATSQEAFEDGTLLPMIMAEIEMAHRNMPAEIALRVGAVYEDIDLTPLVSRLTMPVMLLVGSSGRNGAGTPGVDAAIAQFRALCPHAQLVLIPKAGGTLTMVEQPEASTAAVRAFLAAPD